MIVHRSACSRCESREPNPGCVVCWEEPSPESDCFSLAKEASMREEIEWDLRERLKVDELEYLQEIRKNTRECPFSESNTHYGTM